MQGRNTNPNDRFRSGYRKRTRFGDRGGGRGGGDGGFGAESNLPPPHPRKEEILMEAGRLAAEYLASKGLLPRDSLSPRRGSNHKLKEFMGRDRDSSPVDLRGTYDASNGRRRYRDDEYSRDRFRGTKRTGGYYDREYGSDWGSNGGRRRGWNRRYSDRIEDEDNYPRDYCRNRRGRYDHLPSRSEFSSESGSEDHDNAEDSGSKGSYLSTRKDPPTESYVYLSKAGDGGRMGSSENGDELKSDMSGDLNKRNMVEEEEAKIVQACGVEGDGKCDSELAKLCGFPKVLARPQSSVSKTSEKIDVQEIVMEASNTAEVASDVLKVAAGEEDPKEVDSLANQSATSKIQVNDTSSIILRQPMEESVNSGQELKNQIPTVVTEEEVALQREGVKRQREPSPKDEYSGLDNLRGRKSTPEEKRLLMDVDMVAPVAADQEKPVEHTCFPEIDPEVDVKLEEEKQLLPTSFKICDLNLTGTPEITKIPDDPVLSHVPAPGTDDCCQLLSEDKVVQVNDLEDESHMEADGCDTSRPTDEPMIYSNMDNLLSHAELPDIQDGYSLELSGFHRTDISRCPSVPSDLSNLQEGMGLNDAEGFPNEDDPIYALERYR
ncbi:uncharacterized protein M6B38_120380 [Iris pallida]|uniref:Uncharacterized protein n=1 Tax=Iris pallida TaxID=29817 RepID=A0AAX6H8Q5_IRIPA|nr:uncharacterized protein M6B38_120380 [Iris pallida]